MFGLQWYDILLVVIVFLLFFTSILQNTEKTPKTAALTTATAVRLKTAQAKIL